MARNAGMAAEAGTAVGDADLPVANATVCAGAKGFEQLLVLWAGASNSGAHTVQMLEHKGGEDSGTSSGVANSVHSLACSREEVEGAGGGAAVEGERAAGDSSREEDGSSSNAEMEKS